MSEKNKNSYAFGPSFILAITILTLIGSLFGAVSYLLFQHFSVEDYPKYDAKTALDRDETDLGPKLPEMADKIEWIAYANDNYGFSFLHPKDWRITKDLFSEDFILVVTNKTYTSDISGEIRIKAVKETSLAAAYNPKNESDDGNIVYGYATSFSHTVNLAGKDKKEFVRFYYLELDGEGKRIPKDDWKYFDIYKKIVESFTFTNK